MHLSLSLALGGLRAGGAPDGYDVFVLAGQSNMVGRYGPVDGVLDATNARIFQYGYDAETVSLASDPLDHRNETADTIGLGLTFAKAHLVTMPANRSILLVPVAQGSTNFGSGFWRSGGSGDTGAIARLNAAMTQGDGVNVLKGILWHQGESDSAMTEAEYAADLDALIARWRSSMTGASATTPFVCGQTLIGGTLTAAGVSAALTGLPERLSYTGYVESDGLVGGGDNLHFSAASLRTFGTRYYTQWQGAVSNVTAVPNAIDDLVAVFSSGQAVLEWTAPRANRSAITDYIVEYRADGGSWLVFADGTSATPGATVTGLTDGVFYEFRVSAVNGIGQGPASNIASKPVPIRDWVFGTDNASMTDSIAGNSLVPVSTSLTNSANYVTTAGRLGGARSDVVTPAIMTIAAVCRVSANGILFGSLSATTGASFIYANPNIRVNVRGGTLSTLSYTAGQWRFMALSIEDGVSRIDYIGDATTPQVQTFSGTFTEGSGFLGIGDTYFDSAGSSGVADIAKFQIFDIALTEEDLNTLYADVVAEMATRGITVL